MGSRLAGSPNRKGGAWGFRDEDGAEGSFGAEGLGGLGSAVGGGVAGGGALARHSFSLSLAPFFFFWKDWTFQESMKPVDKFETMKHGYDKTRAMHGCYSQLYNLTLSPSSNIPRP
jgi:hypothetical protein